MGSQYGSAYHVEDDDPLSAVAELSNTQAPSRDQWQLRIETQMRLSCTADEFRLHATLRAWDGASQPCDREWHRAIARDLL